jgi:tetratricopeptide (TPR) repeat protein
MDKVAEKLFIQSSQLYKDVGYHDNAKSLAVYILLCQGNQFYEQAEQKFLINSSDIKDYYSSVERYKQAREVNDTLTQKHKIDISGYIVRSIERYKNKIVIPLLDQQRKKEAIVWYDLIGTLYACLPNTALFLAETYASLAALQFSIGRADKAIAFYNKAAKLYRQAGDRERADAVEERKSVLYKKSFHEKHSAFLGNERISKRRNQYSYLDHHNYHVGQNDTWRDHGSEDEEDGSVSPTWRDNVGDED